MATKPPFTLEPLPASAHGVPADGALAFAQGWEPAANPWPRRSVGRKLWHYDWETAALAHWDDWISK